MLTSLALAGGTAAGASAPTEKAEDVCGLLEPAEIQSVFDAQVAAGEETQPDVCEWMTHQPNGSRVVVLLLRANEQNVRRVFANGKRRFHWVEVEGLGRDAFYAQGVDSVWVVKNKRTFFFVQGLFGIEDPVTRAQLVRLARLALPRA